MTAPQLPSYYSEQGQAALGLALKATFGLPWRLNSLTAADRTPSRALARRNACWIPGLVGDGRVEVS
jgi:hypothetical protein